MTITYKNRLCKLTSVGSRLGKSGIGLADDYCLGLGSYRYLSISPVYRADGALDYTAASGRIDHWQPVYFRMRYQNQLLHRCERTGAT
jgi:hypothetical protein